MQDQNTIQELKSAFYGFCESLSLDEIASNPLLLYFVESLEQEICEAQKQVA